jgi:thiosulfate/3-mercaptopyruvate sulfurtransferase
MFRVFGHGRVAVLDGGLGKWQREGRPLERGGVQPERGRFTARLDASRVRTLAAVRANLDRPTEQVVDMRSAGRFAATEPEPRAGIRGGHIPGSHNVPFETLVHADGTMRSASELRSLLERAGVDPNRPIVASCGSGVTACALVLALQHLGHDRVAVYDGSWTEWGGSADTPVATGVATPVDARAETR